MADTRDGERRRSPRFPCAGQATICGLPLDGKSIPATLRNLSAGGICVSIATPVELGARTEIVVRANAASFRAAALVAGRTALGTGLQFLQVSARGKDVLADLLEQLARLQALNRKLRSPRIDEDTERMLTTRRDLGFLTIRERPLSLPDSDVSSPDAPVAAATVIPAAPKISIDPEIDESRLIRIDLFC
jgi:hypothetical protein